MDEQKRSLAGGLSTWRERLRRAWRDESWVLKLSSEKLKSTGQAA